jgi:uncharacterized protein (DUF1499 family)
MAIRLPAFPESRPARLAERMAIAALLVALGGVLATRSAQIEPHGGILTILGAVVLAAAAIAIGIVAAVEMWRQGSLGLGRLFRTLIVAILVLAYPAWLASKALRLPVLNDISTDIEDPPVFSTSRAVLAARGGNSPPDIDRRQRVPQLRAYPTIKTITLEHEPEEAFQLVLKAARGMKWQIIEETRPDDRRGQGRIEAIDESRIMRFRDDITIRLRVVGEETKVDIRSVSRIGRHDLGVNAARIQALIQEIENPSD